MKRKTGLTFPKDEYTFWEVIRFFDKLDYAFRLCTFEEVWVGLKAMFSYNLWLPFQLAAQLVTAICYYFSPSVDVSTKAQVQGLGHRAP